MPRGMDFPPRPPKKTEAVQDITLHSFEDLGKHVAGVSDGIDEPSGASGGKEKLEPATVAEELSIERSEEASSTLPAEVDPVLEEAEKMSANAKDLYFSLAEEIRNAGVEPNDIPEVWNEAHTTYLRMIGVSNSLKKAKTEKERADLAKLFDKLAMALGEDLSSKAGMAVERVLAERPARPETKAEHRVALQAAVEKLSPKISEAETPAEKTEEDAAPAEKPKVKKVSKAEREERIRVIREELAELEERARHSSRNAGLEERAVLLEEELRGLESKSRKKKSDIDAETAPEVLPVFQPSTEAEKLALETRGSEAIQKLAQELGPAPRTTTEMSEASAPYVTKMYESEKAYLDALKAHHQERNIGSVMLEQFAGHRLPKEVRKLREEWVASRAEYAGFMKQSASERHMAKEGNAHGARREKVLERYQRIVIAREVVLGAEEAEQRAQLEGLDKREHGWVDKAYEGYKKLPPGVRILGTTALLTTAGIIATGGGVFAVAPAGLALGRAGLRWAAEANRGTAIGNTASGLALVFSIGAVGGLVGQKGAELFHKAAGTERKAGEKLEQREELGNLGSAKQLDALSKSRQKALNVTETIGRQSRWARIIGALTGGALFGHAMHGGHDDVAGTHPVVPNPASAGQAPHIQTLQEYAQHPSATSPLTKDEFDQLSGNVTINPSAEDVKHFTHLGESTPASVSMPDAHHDIAVAHEPASQMHHEQMHHAEKPNESGASAQPSSPEAPVRLTDEDRNLIQEWEIKYGGLPPHSDEHMTEVLTRLREENGPDAFKDVHFEAAAHETPAVPESAAPEAPAPAAPEAVAHEEPAPAEPAPTEAPTPAPVAVPAPPEPVHAEAAPIPQASIETTPVPHEAPAPVNAAPQAAHEQVPAPQEESSASDTTPSSEQPVETMVVNTHGLEIDKVTPHIYADKQGVLIAYGGTTEEQLKMVTKFLKNSENFGKTVHIMTSTPDPLTGYPDVVPFVSQPGTGSFGPGLILRDSNDLPILPPGDNDLVKKIL